MPNPFCGCELCEHARRFGGRDCRRRSMFRINERVCIDLGPDAALQSTSYGDFTGLRHLLVTHTHEDHFYYGLLETRALTARPPELPLNVYLTGEAFGLVDILRGSRAVFGGKLPRYEREGVVAFHRLEWETPVMLDGIEVTPFRGNHTGNLGERPANYFLRLPDGQTIYYGVDTGYYLPETLSALTGRYIGVLISECTNADRPLGEKPNFHLNFQGCLCLFRELLEFGIIDEQTRIYLTHLNHKHTASHSKMERLAAGAGLPCQITIAYDGLAIPK